MTKYEEMDNKIKANWISLLMAIDTIDEHCEHKKITFDDIEVKQTAIKHFISETHLKIEEELNHLDELENQKKTYNTNFNNVLSQISNA